MYTGPINLEPMIYHHMNSYELIYDVINITFCFDRKRQFVGLQNRGYSGSRYIIHIYYILYIYIVEENTSSLFFGGVGLEVRRFWIH